MAEALIRRRHPHRKTPSVPSITPYTAPRSSSLKQVLLHDWWLIKPGSDFHGKWLGVGGFTYKGSQGIKSFSSAPVVKRHDAVTLETVDGVTVMVHGLLNRKYTLENGFSHEICDHFQIGFPFYWEEFAATSVLKGTNYSDSYKTPVPDNRGPNMLTKKIIDDILQKHCSGASNAEKESSRPVQSMVSPPDGTFSINKRTKTEQNVQRIGPLTRSRTKLLDTRRTRS